MRRIDRTRVPPPPSLQNYSYPANSWDDVAQHDKNEWRARLGQMQHTGCNECAAAAWANQDEEFGHHRLATICAYCESATWGDGHIEHFRRKNPNHFPHLTFAWDNLFVSCNGSSGNGEHCGHHKDHGAGPYNPNDLVKPDVDDPDDFLFFAAGGDVRVRSGITAAMEHKARATIRVFHLDDGALEAAREKAVGRYVREKQSDLDEVMNWPTPDATAWIQQEVDAVHHKPYGTAIRHYLLSQ